MAYFMFQASYTPEAWKAQLKKPGDRLAAVRPVIEKLGGRMEHAWLSFGEYDVVAICSSPDLVSQAAFSVAAASAGHLKAVRTTPLLTIEEGIQAMKVAGKLTYPTPG